ncbi:MAG: hypothetical protein AB7R77_01860 [Ilumatobacteraceae bacterium]
MESAAGRYVPANSNLLTTVAEPGAGPEVILPLNNRSRLQQLLSLPEVAGPLGAAFDDPDSRRRVGAWTGRALMCRCSSAASN